MKQQTNENLKLSRFYNNNNSSLISNSFFSDFSNVSEGIQHNQLKNFVGVSRKMEKLNAPINKINNNLYGNNQMKKNYNVNLPYIRYESDGIKNNMVQKKSDFSKSINIIQPLSKSINLSNKSSSTIINNSSYGEFISSSKNSNNINNSINNSKSNNSQISHKSTLNKTISYKDYYLNNNSPQYSSFNYSNQNNYNMNPVNYEYSFSNNLSYKNIKNNKSIINY